MTKHRRRFMQAVPLEQRLEQEAKGLRTEARELSAGAKREKALRKARENEVAARMTEWLTSPRLRADVACLPANLRTGGKRRDQHVASGT
ncbi:hypothetical protein ACVILK_005360 [Bradyrhizobium embrapense]